MSGSRYPAAANAARTALDRCRRGRAGPARWPSRRTRRRSSAPRARRPPGRSRRPGPARGRTPRSRARARRARRPAAGRSRRSRPSSSSVDRRADPVDLGDHVPGPAGQLGVQASRGRRASASRRLAQAEGGRGLLDGRPGGCRTGRRRAGAGPWCRSPARPGRRRPGRTGTCRVDRRGCRAAARARPWPSSDAAWSMPPVAAPTISFSARTQAAASSRRPVGRSRRGPSPNRSSAASAVAHSSAADDDSPAPSGTVSVTSRSSPRTGCPAARSAHSTPAA